MSRNDKGVGKVDILHIYFGTAGAAGLYLHEIYIALKNKFHQECIVNYYFPFDYGRKYFFGLTEMAGANFFRKFKYFRYFVRYAELFLGLLRSLYFVLRKKPSVINYSLISHHFLEYLFLKMVGKLTDARIMLTLHDVVPFESQYSKILSSNAMKQKIISLADYLLVHNESSIVDLKANFDFDASALRMHSFPVMDANYMFDANIGRSSVQREFVFLFVGHARLEKGVDILIEAWRNIGSLQRSAKLIFAGNFEPNSSILDSINSLENVVVLNNFLSDDQYFGLIENADCVVLPYKRGTNSGIPGTALSLGTDVICSDIPMFLCNSLISGSNYFAAGSSESLATAMRRTLSAIGRDAGLLQAVVAEYRDGFTREIVELYAPLVIQNEALGDRRGSDIE